jgi:glycosyltransferase involved in cell wall biosynthesis
MKLLLSAYACEPGKGSEPGVGWNWVQALLRRGYDLQVITRSNNRMAIENATKAGARAAEFIYCDLPSWSRFWKKWPGGIYFYYLLWQIAAYRLARRLHATERFDCVHHITFVSFRQPSFMGFLGIPFLFGPVGGGETMPRQLRKGLSFAGSVAELARSAWNSLVAVDPFMNITFSRAQIIACTTEETLARIPRRYHSKCVVQRAIGIDTSKIERARTRETPRHQFLYVGRLLYWKGLHLVLRALAEVRLSIPDVALRIIGDGGDRSWLMQTAHRQGVSDLVEWIGEQPHDDICAEYRKSIAFVFPSLHDSGGMVVIEALAAGLPVICLDLGGPGSIANASCGIVLKTDAKDEKAIIQDLARAMVVICADDGYRDRLAKNAPARAAEMTWDAAVDALYSSTAVARIVNNDAGRGYQVAR